MNLKAAMVDMFGLKAVPREENRSTAVSKAGTAVALARAAMIERKKVYQVLILLVL